MVKKAWLSTQIAGFGAVLAGVYLLAGTAVTLIVAGVVAVLVAEIRT